MDDATQRLEFVFGGIVDPSEWREASIDDRLPLMEKRFGAAPAAGLYVRLGVVEQLLSGEPPQVWETAQRLIAAGLGPERVLSQLAMVLAQTVSEALDAEEFDTDRYAARLGQLPLPDPETMERVLLDVAAESRVIKTDTLVARTAERLGFAGDDPLLVHLLELVEEDLAGEDGPLIWLPGDRTGHAPSLCDGIVLAHVLSDTEHEMGVLVVSFDLAGFGRVSEPSFHGDPLVWMSAEPGHLAWRGPKGWLAGFAPGTVVAVRVATDGAVEIEALPEVPPLAPGLVAALREVYDAAADEPQLPVSGEELLFGLLAEEPAFFDRAQAPLRGLCEAAGLEQRASAVAHDPVLWANRQRASRMARVTFAADGDDDLVRATFDVFDVIDELHTGGDVDVARIGAALDALADLEVLALVIDELFDDRHRPVDIEVVASRLVEAAQGRRQRGTTRLLAAMAAETAGDLAAAEQHLELAIEADPGNVPAIDRLAWYASDRGDAARAMRLWRRFAGADTIGPDLEIIESFARPAETEPGRNEPCWCGSGRKYKHCHLGVVEPPELRDRVGWLYRKAVAYLRRSGPPSREAVMEVGLSRMPDLDELESALDDPIVLDLVLTEGGWFSRFLAERGSLLPDDEASLAASWTTVDRTVYEVTAVTPGTGLAVRDLRTGDRLDVRESTFSKTASGGALVCARALPDGETHKFVGPLFVVAPGTEAALLDLLDEQDPHAIAAWVRDLHRPPELGPGRGTAG